LPYLTSNVGGGLSVIDGKIERKANALEKAKSVLYTSIGGTEMEERDPKKGLQKSGTELRATLGRASERFWYA